MAQSEKTVWLLGAGFSRPLGGPLFTDLISVRYLRWVKAWVDTKGIGLEPRSYTFDDCVKIYLQGYDRDLWKNAEECIALLDSAQAIGSMAAAVVHSANTDNQNGVKEEYILNAHDKLPLRLDQVFARFTQFLAIATSHYVPDGDDLPEAWRPYENWMETLGPDDTIISFNYDRVVETLKRIKKRGCDVIKPHGTSPDHDLLIEHIRANKPVRSICVPGPSKLAASRAELESEWQKARSALHSARRLVVIGYSFPASDALSLDFVLRHSKAACVDIVLGPSGADNNDGERVCDLFTHLRDKVANMNRYAQTYLTEGTARAKDGRFMHWTKLPQVDDGGAPRSQSTGPDPYEISTIDPYGGAPKRPG